MKCILLNNQQMQLFAVNFIPLPGSLYVFRVFCTPIIRSTILTVSTASGTNHSIVSATFSQCGLATLEEGSWYDTIICTRGCRYS